MAETEYGSLDELCNHYNFDNATRLGMYANILLRISSGISPQGSISEVVRTKFARVFFKSMQSLPSYSDVVAIQENDVLYVNDGSVQSADEYSPRGAVLSSNYIDIMFSIFESELLEHTDFPLSLAMFLFLVQFNG